jgi:hypothetical protein
MKLSRGRGGVKTGEAKPQEDQVGQAPQGRGMLGRMVSQDQAAQQSGAAPQGRGMIANLARRSQAAQPQEGAPEMSPPRGRGFMKNSGSMMGTAFSRLQANPGFQEALAKNKAMRGASTQGMKKGGSVSASKRADGCAKKGKTKGRML